MVPGEVMPVITSLSSTAQKNSRCLLTLHGHNQNPYSDCRNLYILLCIVFWDRWPVIRSEHIFLGTQPNDPSDPRQNGVGACYYKSTKGEYGLCEYVLGLWDGSLRLGSPGDISS